MKFSLKDKIFVLFLLIISFILIFDLFANNGQSSNMDGTVHITTITQFYKAMQDGEWFVRWSDGFANYGLSVPLFAHQLVSYSGALLTFITHDALLSFNILFLIGTFLSTFFIYIFLRLYFSEESSLGGSVLFHFSAYRIINLYIRGAIHEYISILFLALILLSLYYLIHKRKSAYLLGLTCSFLGLLLIHPMMIVIYSFVIGPYFMFLLWGKQLKELTRLIASVFFSFVVALLISAYYYIPLYLEKKYYYFGAWKSQFEPGQTLGLINFLSPDWYYYYRDDVLSRGHFIKLGLIEAFSIISSFIVSIVMLLRGVKRSTKSSLFILFSILSLLIIFMMTEYANVFYQKITLLGNIQFPWRMMSVLIIIPPFLIAYLFSKIKNNTLVIYGFILIVCFTRFPQLYGKNYTVHPKSYYFFSLKNLHTNKLNTIWTGETEYYPIKKNKAEIIAGQGSIKVINLKNSQRTYKINAQNDRIRMVDNTFYYPGWIVYVDGKPTTIEFQDMNYRGVITYYVPKGDHTVLIRFEETKIRKLADMISVFSLSLLIIIVFIEKRYKILQKYLSSKAVLR